MNIKSIVHHGNNITFLRKFPDNHFKLIIGDPPYYSGPEKRKYYGNQVSKIKVKRREYPITDEWKTPNPLYFKEIMRVSENQIIFGINYFDHKLGSGRLIWDKVNGASSFSDCEIAYCSYHTSVRLYRYMWNGMMQGKSIYQGHIMQGNKSLNEVRIHTTQKPVNLYKWIFSNYLKGLKGPVLDTHLGSGSSRIAAWDLGIPFEGIEIDKGIIDLQDKRFKTHISQHKIEFPDDTKRKIKEPGLEFPN